MTSNPTSVHPRRCIASAFVREACKIIVEKDREIIRLERRLAEAEAELARYRAASLRRPQ